jgi:hypothetical protein
MVGHEAEYVDVASLRFQVDGQLRAQRTVNFRVRPRTMKNAEQRLRSRFVQDGPELADPIGKDVATPSHPCVRMLA